MLFSRQSLKEGRVSKRLVMAAGACAAVMLAFVASAMASPPTHFTDSDDYSGSVSCGSFDDLFEGHLDVRGITTYDADGNPIKDVVHISGWERNWRSDQPSVSITAKRDFNITYVYATDTEKDAGNIFTQTAPGQGVLFHDVGNIQFQGGEVVVVHGPHDVFDQGDAAFCNALLAVS
jgi:hypothetical protein